MLQAEGVLLHAQMGTTRRSVPGDSNDQAKASTAAHPGVNSNVKAGTYTHTQETRDVNDNEGRHDDSDQLKGPAPPRPVCPQAG